jgi:hypothetical protein
MLNAPLYGGSPMLHVVGIRMDDHLDNRILLALPGLTQVG